MAAYWMLVAGRLPRALVERVRAGVSRRVSVVSGSGRQRAFWEASSAKKSVKKSSPKKSVKKSSPKKSAKKARGGGRLGDARSWEDWLEPALEGGAGYV